MTDTLNRHDLNVIRYLREMEVEHHEVKSVLQICKALRNKQADNTTRKYLEKLSGKKIIDGYKRKEKKKGLPRRMISLSELGRKIENIDDYDLRVQAEKLARKMVAEGDLLTLYALPKMQEFQWSVPAIQAQYLARYGEEEFNRMNKFQKLLVQALFKLSPKPVGNFEWWNKMKEDAATTPEKVVS